MNYLKLVFLSSSLLILTSLGMQNASQRSGPRTHSIKVKKFEELVERVPGLQKIYAENRTKKRNETGKTAQGYSYKGPKNWDIIRSILPYTFKNKKQFAIADQDANQTVIYDADNFNINAQLQDLQPWGIPALATNGTQLAAVSGQNILIFNLDTLQQTGTLRGHIDIIGSINFNPKNPNQLVSGSYDTTIKTWNLNTNSCDQTLNDDDEVLSVDFCPNGNGQLVSVNSSQQNALAIWAIETSQKIKSAQASLCAKYDDAGATIAAGLPGELLLYNAATLQLLRSLKLPGDWAKYNAEISAIDFNKEALVASGQLSDIFICDTQLTTIQADINSGMLGVDVRYGPDGKVYSSCYGCTVDEGPYIRIWDAKTMLKKAESEQPINLEAKNVELSTAPKSQRRCLIF